ncbi:MAG: hypothetical protein IJM83_03150 [Firmicutes bacterium]|nr:hypothetical protein [Lachnospiraceae bacterium]MBQ7058284.1 hypothetical protein [Bacillota bacterium]
MTVRMNQYDLKTVINGIYQIWAAFEEEQQTEIAAILLKLIDVCERMNPRRRAKIRPESGEARLILLCLNEWRNRFIKAGKADGADGVGEVMVRFAR